MNKDQVKGRAKAVTGKIKEVAGKMVGDRKTEIKGAVEKTAGKVQADRGDMKERAKSNRY